MIGRAEHGRKYVKAMTRRSKSHPNPDYVTAYAGLLDLMLHHDNISAIPEPRVTVFIRTPRRMYIGHRDSPLRKNVPIFSSIPTDYGPERNSSFCTPESYWILVDRHVNVSSKRLILCHYGRD